MEEEGHSSRGDKDIIVGVVEHDVWLKMAKKLVRETCTTCGHLTRSASTESLGAQTHIEISTKDDNVVQSVGK